MWYSSFWLKGPTNHLNLKVLVSKFVPLKHRGVPHLRPRGAATWDLKGQQRDLEAQQHGTGLSRGYFLYFSATDFKPQSVWWRTLWCLPSSADRQSPFPLETNHSWTKKYFNGEDLSTFFPLLLVQCSSILLGAEMNSLVKVKVKKGKAEGRQSEIVVLYLCHHTSWIVTNKYLALVTEAGSYHNLYVWFVVPDVEVLG